MADSSYITVPVAPGDCNAIGAQKDCQRPRTTEIAALSAVARRPRVLSATHQRLLRLERIAVQPRSYPQVRDRPARALAGKAVLLWIAARVGMHWAEVDEWLRDAAQIMRGEE